MTDIFVSFGSTFPVPAAVADHLLKLASHDQLKVLLYVLSRAGAPLSAEQIASACGVSADAVEEAIVWWQDANILSGTQPAPPAVRLTGSSAEAPAAVQSAAPVPPMQKPDAAPAPAVLSDSSRFSITPGALAERLKSAPALSEMFRTMETIIGRTPNYTEQSSMLWMHDYLGLSPEMILTLAAYCRQTDTFQVRYMEKIAADWQERGVRSLAQAEADVQRRMERTTFTGQIMKLFEMTRRPTENQQKYIDEWQRMQYPAELIRLAYETCRDLKNDKVWFPYIDGILKRWHADGIHSADAARAEQEAHAAAARTKNKTGKRSGASGTAAGGGSPQPGSSSIDMAEVEKLMNQF